MFKLLVVVLLVGLYGCDDFVNTDWTIESMNYRCDDLQLEAVAREIELCSTTSFKTSFCFASAKISICDKISKRN